MEVASTLAYNDTAAITAVKSFIGQAPCHNLINMLKTNVTKTVMLVIQVVA
jgi:hypothetical protein